MMRRMYNYKTFMCLIQERIYKYMYEYNNFFKNSERLLLLLLVMTSNSHVTML